MDAWSKMNLFLSLKQSGHSKYETSNHFTSPNLTTIQIGDPKMDSGFLQEGESMQAEYDCARTLSPGEVVWLMDELICYEASTPTGKYPTNQTHENRLPGSQAILFRKRYSLLATSTVYFGQNQKPLTMQRSRRIQAWLKRIHYCTKCFVHTVWLSSRAVIWFI